MNEIYLDYAATTPIHPDVLTVLSASYQRFYANPSSIHRQGREAKLAIDMAREIVCDSIHAKPLEIFFTAGGTESDNMAVAGFLTANSERGKHIISSEMEHPAVLNTLLHFRDKFGFELSFVDINSDGSLDLAHFESLIRPDTILTSLMYVNNEIGVINPIAEIGRLCKIHNIALHCDAVQAFGKVPINLDELPIDIMSTSSHKIYGPKGAGFTFIRKGIKVDRINYGGSQEFDKRSGTENVHAIVAFGKAIEIRQEIMRDEFNRLEKLRDRFITSLKDSITDIQINGTTAQQLPHIVNISFAGCDGEAMLLNLDSEGICVSAGSACASGSRKASKVIQAIPMDSRFRTAPIRFSMGSETNEDQIKQTVSALIKVVERLRQSKK
ncbi:MAG: cysteine desulfurase [Calditrichaeota bacterium]|nr:cysteine desulfurase [Calditrichota bacterium]